MLGAWVQQKKKKDAKQHYRWGFVGEDTYGKVIIPQIFCKVLSQKTNLKLKCYELKRKSIEHIAGGMQCVKMGTLYLYDNNLNELERWDFDGLDLVDSYIESDAMQPMTKTESMIHKGIFTFTYYDSYHHMTQTKP